jgi:hypothetical protein
MELVAVLVGGAALSYLISEIRLCRADVQELREELDRLSLTLPKRKRDTYAE